MRQIHQTARPLHSKLAVLGLVLAVMGCGTGRTATGAPVATDRRLENLRSVASRHIACPMHAISVEPVTEQVWQARGCGAAREFAIVDAGSIAQWQPIIPANVRASNQLACPAEQLVQSAPTGAQRQVAGCGRNASYELACTPTQCDWVMTSQGGTGGRGVTVTPPGQASAPATPAPRAPVVVPEYGDRGGYAQPDPTVDQAVRRAIDAQRAPIAACVPNVVAGIVVHARWDADGFVRLSLDPPWADTPTEQCVRETTGAFRVTTGQPGALSHVVQ